MLKQVLLVVDLAVVAVAIVDVALVAVSVSLLKCCLFKITAKPLNSGGLKQTIKQT